MSEAEDQPQDGVLKKRPREDAAPLHRHATAPTLSSSAKVLSRPLKHARTAPAVGGDDGSVFPLTRIELTPDWLIYVSRQPFSPPAGTRHCAVSL